MVVIMNLTPICSAGFLFGSDLRAIFIVLVAMRRIESLLERNAAPPSGKRK